MRRARLIFRLTVILFVGLFLHYVLPQHDVARITGTEVIRQDFSRWNRIFYAQAESGNVEGANRDVLFINTIRKKTYLFGLIRGGDEVMIFRNEDTGWIWPPYFKFDSRDLQGQAQEYTSTSANPQWVEITHYGWRNRFLTVFPNALGIKPIDGPDYRPIPWFNIFFAVFLVAAYLTMRAMWRQFRERSVDPLLDKAGDTFDEVQADMSEKRSGLTRWLNSWRAKDKR
jgi:hypothetical protein